MLLIELPVPSPNTRALLVSTLLAAIALAPMRAARADEQSDVEKVRAAYLAHQFDEAEGRLRMILDPKTGTLHDPLLVTQARMYWGAVLVAKGRPDEAAAIFEKILLEDPQFEPDPLSFPTNVIDLFIDVRAKLRDRLNQQAQDRARREAERRQHEEDEKKRAAARLALLERLAGEERVLHLHSRWLALVPFGVGQFQNGDRTLGWIFLGTEAALVLGTAVTLPIYLTDLQYRTEAHAQRDDFRAQEYIDRANAVRTVNLALAGAFAVTAISGIIEAQVSFVPESVEVRRRAIPQVGWATPVIAPAPEGRGGVVGIGGRF